MNWRLLAAVTLVAAIAVASLAFGLPRVIGAPRAERSFSSGIATATPAVAPAVGDEPLLAAKAAPRRSTKLTSPGTGKRIALTIDDGYNFQPEMLAYLKSRNVRCTTFLLGSWASSHRDQVKMMADAGFEIANHSWSHPNFTTISAEQIASELSKTQSVLREITGTSVALVRPPYGATNEAASAAIAAAGYRSVMWSKTFGDSGNGVTADIAYSNVMTTYGPVKGGDIILCHWGSKATLEALKRVVPELQAQGYTFVTVSELYGR